MKAIHKKTKENDSLHKVRKLLVEDPSGHHFLPKQNAHQAMLDVSDLINLKEANCEKKRSAHLLISSISICLSLLLVIGLFEWRTTENGSDVNLELNTQNFEDLLDIPQTQQIQKPPAQVQAPTIIEVDNEEIIEEIEIDLDIEMTEDTRIEEVVFDVGAPDNIPEEKVDEIFTIVEEQPLPKGGIKAFYDFVGSNLDYPSGARRMGIEGRVFVEFVVEKDGSLTDIKVVKGIGAGCDEEAVRVISQAPKWNPGKQRGREVRVRMIMPIMFKLVVS